MKNNIKDNGTTEKLIRATLLNHGIAWAALRASATEIILFGSTGCGLSTVDSDIDLLCVGAGERIRSERLDLKWIAPATLRSRRWLDSELATHIASFGIWLHGLDNWSSSTRITTTTLDFKRRLIFGRLRGLRYRWNLLARPYQRKHVTKIRRDLQRLALLATGEAVPPTPVLDFFWSIVADKERALFSLMEHEHGRNLLTAKDVDLFGSLTCSSFFPARSASFQSRVSDWAHDCNAAANAAPCRVLAEWLRIATPSTDQDANILQRHCDGASSAGQPKSEE
jgi:hypothetical protein